MIEASGGKIFSVTFVKRSTGTSRRMTGRRGVRKGVNGEGQPFNPKDHGLITVCEFVANPERVKGRVRNMGQQFRHVSVEGITGLRIQGKDFQVA